MLSELNGPTKYQGKTRNSLSEQKRLQRLSGQTGQTPYQDKKDFWLSGQIEKLGSGGKCDENFIWAIGIAGLSEQMGPVNYYGLDCFTNVCISYSLVVSQGYYGLDCFTNICISYSLVVSEGYYGLDRFTNVYLIQFSCQSGLLWFRSLY